MCEEKKPKDWVKEVQKQVEDAKKEAVCPHCGRCPTCGRRYNDYWDWPFRPNQPMWVGYPTDDLKYKVEWTTTGGT